MKYQINIFYGKEDIDHIFEEVILKELEKENYNFDNSNLITCTKNSIQKGSTSV